MYNHPPTVRPALWNPVCGAPATRTHDQHRVYIGGQVGEQHFPGTVSMREQMHYVMEFADPQAASDGLHADQIGSDLEVMNGVMRRPTTDGYVYVDDETFAAIKRLVDDAVDYAATCGYAEDPTCTPVEQSIAGFALVCWP